MCCFLQSAVRSRLRRAIFAWRSVDSGAQLDASFSLLEKERASHALSQQRLAEATREVATLRANNGALLADITNYRALEAQHEQLVASSVASERMDGILAGVKEQANAKLVQAREASDATIARLKESFAAQISDMQVGTELRVD
jgi:hypothetical protein